MESFFEAIKSLGGLPIGGAQFSNLYGAAVRILLPVLAALLLLRCAKSLLTFRKEPEIWAWLCLPDGNQLPITHWENVIGRNKRSDIVIDLPTISRSHAVLTRYETAAGPSATSAPRAASRSTARIRPCAPWSPGM